MTRRLIRSARDAALLSAVLVVFAECSPATGPSIEFIIPTPTTTEASGLQVGAVAANETETTVTAATETRPRLGFVQGEEAIALANGRRVPLGDDKIVEVFLAPYPPDWQTDLHLFLMDKTSFDPITDVNVDLEYEMVWMNHGIDGQIGSKIADGHYVLPLAFLMYGDWSVDTTVTLPEGKKHLRFIVKFDP